MFTGMCLWCVPDEEAAAGGDEERAAGGMSVAQLKRIRGLQLQGEAATSGVLRTATLLRHKVPPQCIPPCALPRLHSQESCRSSA
jgi:hypothetical protein